MSARLWLLALVLGTLVCLSAAQPAAAQWLAPPPWDASVRLDNGYTMRDSKPVSVGDVAAMAVMGLGAGTIGLWGGFLLGGAMAPSESAAAVVGIAAGSVLLPYGVHLGNERRGRYDLEALVSLGLGLGTVAVFYRSGSEALFFIALPVSQLITSIVIEVKTSR